MKFKRPLSIRMNIRTKFWTESMKFGRFIHVELFFLEKQSILKSYVNVKTSIKYINLLATFQTDCSLVDHSIFFNIDPMWYE